MKTSEGFELEPLADWASALAHVKARGVIWYKAPLSPEPSSCACKLTKDGKSIRMLPAPRLETDPFTVGEDRLHLLFKTKDK